MSRTGRKPITLPQGVQVQLEGRNIIVQGPKGRLTHKLPPQITVEQQQGKLLVERCGDEPEQRSLHGLARSLIDNMVTGVTKGFSRNLELVGVGYRAMLQGEKLVLNVGYSHPVVFEPEENLEIEVPTATRIIIRGIDKQQVGNFAAGIRKVHPPEPYKGKGVRYENERIRRKVGKAGK